MTETVIIVDDDPEYAEELRLFLTNHQFDCEVISDAAELIPAVQRREPDLILLDQRLGSTTGTQVLRQLRTVSAVPCLILTALEDPFDRVLGLELGADDYIQKTAMPREIVARVRAVLRRTRAVPPEKYMTPSAGDWSFLPDKRELFRPDGSPCRLTAAEFSLLRTLVDAQGEPVTREILTEQVYGREFRAGDRAIDALVMRLRRKIEPDTEYSSVIKSARQHGYVFVGFPIAGAPTATSD